MGTMSIHQVKHMITSLSQISLILEFYFETLSSAVYILQEPPTTISALIKAGHPFLELQRKFRKIHFSLFQLTIEFLDR